jgi:diguanylate cyclase (GGDEF)-like protein
MMRPSRRVIVLTTIATACGALVVAVALVGIGRPRDSISELDHRVAPASAALSLAVREFTSSQQQFLTALQSPPEARGALISQSQDASSRSVGAWDEYLRRAFDTPGELRLQKVYVAQTATGQAAGATAFALVDSPDRAAFEAAVANEQMIASQTRTTIEQINQRYYESRITKLLHSADSSLDATRLWILGAFALVLILGLLNAVVLLRGAYRDEARLAANEEERRRELHRSDLESQLQRGLEMEPTEEATYAIVGESLDLVRPDHPVELLIADGSRSHFRQVLSVDTGRDRPGCPVTSPGDCPAASTGQAHLFPSSTRLDACPFLRSRDEPPQSAACIPISIAGTNTGMIHTTGPDDQLPDPGELSELELVARKAGDRIGFLRVLSRTETQARVDLLTGLFNRRSLEDQADEVLNRSDPFVVAFADLDHFKELNDTHGHGAGDRALRLFGRVLRDSVRPADIPARYGGEEFIVLLPDCALSDAYIVADRVRSRLALALSVASVPEFTVSIGLAAWEPPELFTETVDRADAALLEAKTAGRNRVLSSPQSTPPSPSNAVVETPATNGAATSDGVLP